jgi:hypothetical protein
MGSPLNRDNAEQNSRGWYSTEPMMGASLLSAGVLGGMLNGFGDPKVDNRRGADSVPHQGDMTRWFQDDVIALAHDLQARSCSRQKG